jgi:hypothetical protein
MANVIVLSVIIELEVFIVLVDGVVCEMLEEIFHVSF